VCILDHKYFAKVDIAALESRSLKPLYIPDAKVPSPENLNCSVDFKNYTGNHNIFEGF